MAEAARQEPPQSAVAASARRTLRRLTALGPPRPPEAARPLASLIGRLARVPPLLLTALAVAAAALVRWPLDGLLGAEFPFITFLPAILFVTLVAGWGYGLVATAASAALLVVLFFGVSRFSATEGAALALFGGVNGLMILLGESVRRAKARMTGELEAAQGREAALAREIEARARAEEALRESEARARTLGDHISQLAWMADETGSIFWYNRRWYEYTGTTLEEVRGWGWQRVHHPEHVARVVEKISSCFRTGEPWEDTFPLRGADGEYRWFLSRALPIRDGTGRVVRWFGTNTDITAQRAAEERLQRVLETDAIGVLFFNHDGVLIDASEVFLRSTGYTREQIERRALDWRAMTPPEWVAESEAQMRKLAATGRIGPYEKEYLHADGSRSWMLFTGRDLGDGTIVEFAVDISDRKRAEAKLLESEERFRLAADAAGALIYSMNAASGETSIVYGLERLTGYDAAAVQPTSGWWHSLIHPDDQARHLEELERHLERGGVEVAEYRVRHCDGRWLYVQDNRLVIRCERGVALRIVGAITDITARKAAEAEIAALARERESLLEAERSARGEAESANRLKDEFLATLSHELRSPLANIVSWARVLLRKEAKENEKLEQGLTLIGENAMALSHMIGELLEMSRIVAGKVTLEVSPLDLGELLAQCVASHRPGAQERGLELSLRPAEVPKIVLAEPDRLRQVIGNLLTNALKFTPRGGRIEVRTGLAQGGYEIVVEDSGEGIAPEALPHIFERFRQADGSTARRHGGLGLGLAIVKQLVELHGGVIRAESEGRERGARFTVWLPAAPALTLSDARSPNESGRFRLLSEPLAPESLRGLTVLAVEDDPSMLELMVRVLEEHGARVEACRSGAAALAWLREGRAEARVLVSDLGMPEIDGFDLMRAVRTELRLSPERLPAIAVTAYTRPEDRKRALEAGFQAYLTKPWEAAQLIAAVRALGGEPGRMSTSDR